MISWDQFLYVQYQHAHLTALPSHHPYIPPLFQLYHRVRVLGELCQQVQSLTLPDIEEIVVILFSFLNTMPDILSEVRRKRLFLIMVFSSIIFSWNLSNFLYPMPISTAHSNTINPVKTIFSTLWSIPYCKSILQSNIPTAVFIQDCKIYP